MNPTTESAARRRTRRLIRQSFIALLARMPFEQITARHLCEEADINRATFYRYYADLYALMEELSDEMFAKIFSDTAARVKPPDGNTQAVKLEAFRQTLFVAQENKTLLQALMSNPGSNSFLERIETAHKDAFREVNAPPYRNQEEVDLVLHYVASGLNGLFRAWIQSGCAVPAQEVAEMADESATAIYTIAKRFV